MTRGYFGAGLEPVFNHSGTVDVYSGSPSHQYRLLEYLYPETTGASPPLVRVLEPERFVSGD